jgi:hypothetical protein
MSPRKAQHALAEERNQFQTGELAFAARTRFQAVGKRSRLRARYRLFMMHVNPVTPFCSIRYERRAPVPLNTSWITCFEECAKPHQTGSAKSL